MSAATARAVRFDRYGGPEVLYVADVPMPVPAAGEALVEVRAAAINPGEGAIRRGEFGRRSLPSGEGSDLAGVVLAVAGGFGEVAVGEEVLGYSWERSSHATHVAVPVSQLVAKPAALSWEVAGSLYVVGATAWAAVHAVEVWPGATVAVSGAAGGVGGLVVQLLSERGARVLAIASQRQHDWLRAHGAIPIAYGEGLAERLREAAPGGFDAFLDQHGDEYVELAIELGVPPAQINTISGFAAARRVGARTKGSVDGSTQAVLTEMATLVASGSIAVDIAAIYPLDRVADAFRELEHGHTHGKIVLAP